MERWEFEDGTRFEAVPSEAGAKCETCADAAEESLRCDFTQDGKLYRWAATVCGPCGALLTIPGRPERSD